MALKSNMLMSEILPVKASLQVEKPEVRAKLIDDGKSVTRNPYNLRKFENQQNRFCSRLLSFLQHFLSYMKYSNTYHSNSSPSLVNSLANRAYQYSISREKIFEAWRYENSIWISECQPSECNSLSLSLTCLLAKVHSIKCESLNKTPKK